jgi:hypothetical protein
MKNKWKNDVNYVGCGNRRAALLIGDSKRTYLWNRQIIFYPSRLYRGQIKLDLNKLLNLMYSD